MNNPSECSSVLCVLQGPAGTKGDKGERVRQTKHTHSSQKIIFYTVFVKILLFFFILLNSALQCLYLDESSLIFIGTSVMFFITFLYSLLLDLI